MRLVVLPGDGIGPEITEATEAVLDAASERFQLGIEKLPDVMGHASIAKYGVAIRPEMKDVVLAADGLLMGPSATFEYPEQVGPSRFFRKELDLFANIRPARTYPGLPTKCGDMDLVVVRENTEGFYADRNMEQNSGEILITPEVSIAIRKITYKGCERIMRAACELAMRRRKYVTIVHKANALTLTDGMFLRICREVAAEYPELKVDDVIVDAMMAHCVRNPARFDVIVSTNMFGDILSDLTAELSGSLGMGGSVNAGTETAMAQAAHGSAPDIAGKDIANPFSLILSAALLLDWHGRTRKQPRFIEAAAAIEKGVADAVAAHETTRDVGGKLGTRATGLALAARLRK